MFRADRIKTELFGGVGFNQTPTLIQSTNNVPAVTGTNLDSISGLKFQESSGFVTIENIYNTQHVPGLVEADFNTYLAQLQNDVILTVIQKVLQNESFFNQTADLYPYEKSFKNTIEPGTDFVGFRIENVCKDSLINSKISWIELNFDSAKTFNVYLYNSNKPNAAIKTQSVTTIANESVIVSLDDWFLSDESTYKGGDFYWGYFESDLDGAKAIERDFELADVQRVTDYYYIVPMSLTPTGTIIDVTTMTETADTFGLNFGIDIYKDYTEFIVRNKNLFWQAIQIQMSEKVLRLIETSVRSNRIERLTEDSIQDIRLDLYGRADLGIEGITGRLNRLIVDLKHTLFYKPSISKSTHSFSNNTSHQRIRRR